MDVICDLQSRRKKENKRFYEIKCCSWNYISTPLIGEILLDGVNTKMLQLKWFCSQIGLGSQEPALFATSIKENILFGKDGASTD